MKRSCFPFVILVLLAGLWLGLLIGLYQKGQEKEAVIYAHIPEETIRFIDGLLDMIDQSIRFDPDPALTDWDNDTNYGEDEATGLLKLEDDYFVVYFRKGDKGEEKKAGKTLRWAHDAIEPLASLMGISLSERRERAEVADLSGLFAKGIYPYHFLSDGKSEFEGANR